LNKYDIKATFFVTNLMKKVYSNILEEISTHGHEIGLHGRWHEYLSKSNSDEQVELIKNMVADFGYPIHSANFVGRMNDDTIHALTGNGIKYFVYPLINYYRFFSYPKLPANPSLISLKDGDILAIPILVETYGRVWFSIRNMLDSACKESLKTSKHITILCHPFRDGNLQHLGTTEKLIRHLTTTQKMYPIPLKEAVKLEDKKQKTY
jgi:peptidoglycan/xylan/chitin deacetylase (PgdA/CDA1 family)